MDLERGPGPGSPRDPGGRADPEVGSDQRGGKQVPTGDPASGWRNGSQRLLRPTVQAMKIQYFEDITKPYGIACLVLASCFGLCVAARIGVSVAHNKKFPGRALKELITEPLF